MSEEEMASCLDVLNQELRINGPIEVEQYKMGQMREGIKKLVDYMRAKIDRAESRRSPTSERMAIMNARIATDAKAYERDQYLIAALRKQLADKSERMARLEAVIKSYADRCEGEPFKHKPIMGSNQPFSECLGCRAKAALGAQGQGEL